MCSLVFAAGLSLLVSLCFLAGIGFACLALVPLVLPTVLFRLKPGSGVSTPTWMAGFTLLVAAYAWRTWNTPFAAEFSALFHASATPGQLFLSTLDLFPPLFLTGIPFALADHRAGGVSRPAPRA